MGSVIWVISAWIMLVAFSAIVFLVFKKVPIKKK